MLQIGQYTLAQERNLLVLLAWIQLLVEILLANRLIATMAIRGLDCIVHETAYHGPAMEQSMGL